MEFVRGHGARSGKRRRRVPAFGVLAKKRRNTHMPRATHAVLWREDGTKKATKEGRLNSSDCISESIEEAAITEWRQNSRFGYVLDYIILVSYLFWRGCFFFFRSQSHLFLFFRRVIQTPVSPFFIICSATWYKCEDRMYVATGISYFFNCRLRQQAWADAYRTHFNHNLSVPFFKICRLFRLFR